MRIVVQYLSEVFLSLKKKNNGLEGEFMVLDPLGVCITVKKK